MRGLSGAAPGAVLAYLFLALVLVLGTGVDLGSLPLTLAICAVVLVTALVVDHGRLLPETRTVEVALEMVLVGQAVLRARLEDRLAMTCIERRALTVPEARAGGDLDAPAR